MANDTGNCNIVHYGSPRSKSIARSVILSDFHALTLVFDNAFAILDMLEQILSRKVVIETFVDSNTVFNRVPKDGKNTARRLRIDVSAIRDFYANGELAHIAWIPWGTNPAKALTKHMLTTKASLSKLRTSNYLELLRIGRASIVTSC